MHISPQELSSIESHHILQYGKYGGAHDFVSGEVIIFHVKDELCHDGQPDCLGRKVPGRLGDDYYQGVGEPFVTERLKYNEWRRNK